MEHWGYHALIDCRACDIKAITDRDNIVAFVKQLVKDIDMVPFGDTFCAHFATHDPVKAGFSFFQMIETSNISGHLVDANGDGYIDVFSCKPFEVKDVVFCIEEFFAPQSVRVNFITRNA